MSDYTNPGTEAEVVDLSNDVVFSRAPRALFVGTGGNIVMSGANGGSPITWKNVQNGAIIPFRPATIRSTANGTTAADIVALY